MDQKARAVVCRELNRPVVVEEIVVEAPRRNEVMIKLSACGVCHSDRCEGLICANGHPASRISRHARPAAVAPAFEDPSACEGIST